MFRSTRFSLLFILLSLSYFLHYTQATTEVQFNKPHRYIDDIINNVNNEFVNNDNSIGKIDEHLQNEEIKSNQRRDLFESMEATTILPGDNFLKIEFSYTYSDSRNIDPYTVVGFIIDIFGLNDINYENHIILTYDNATIFESDDNADSVIYFDDLTPGEYSFDFAVIYNDNTNSDILLSLTVDTIVNLLCTQETFAAFFSAEIYSPFPILSSYRFCDLDWKLHANIDKNLGHCAIFYEPSLSTALLVFQGTANTTDFITDLQNINYISCSETYSFDCAGEIGDGFSGSYNQLAKTYLTSLSNLQSEKEIKYILITGHSKGASEASLAALDVKYLDIFDEVHITTFGLASFSDSDFADFWDQMINDGQSGIVSTWHSHVDNCEDDGEDVVVTTTEGLFASINSKSIFQDTRCFSSIQPLAIVRDHSILRSSTNSPVPDAGYYFIGTDPDLNDVSVEIFLSEFGNDNYYLSSIISETILSSIFTSFQSSLQSTFTSSSSATSYYYLSPFYCLLLILISILF